MRSTTKRQRATGSSSSRQKSDHAKNRTPNVVEQEILVTDENAGRVDRLVQQLYPRSRSALRGLFANGCVSLNNRPCSDPGSTAKKGDRLLIRYNPQQRYREHPKEFKSKLFRLVYEDNYIVVVDKQAGYLSMPTEKEEQESLISAVNEYLKIKGGRQAGATLVHRLDRDTSGLLVLAKHPNLAQTIKEQFSANKPEREYLAIIRGKLKQPRGTFRSYLATDEDLNQYSTKNPSQGKLAVTHYETVRTFSDSSLVRVHLETGRRNQIRVHFSEKGHPVLGDVRYRPRLAAHALWDYPRLALHAASLSFIHPVKKKKLSFRSPVPAEFRAFLAAAGSEKPVVQSRRRK
jgi:23S rRNA pseudouridine1911/1915/1917 synthase